MIWALGIAATQPVGLREMFGSMTKSFHPGRAAQNGLTAALLASRNFTSSEVGHRGQAAAGPTSSARRATTARSPATRQELRDLAQHLQAVRLRHRHSSGDRRLHPAAQRASADRRRDRAHRSRRSPAGPRTDRQEDTADRARSKFSVYFAAALAIVKGSAGMRDFSDAERARSGDRAAAAIGSRRRSIRRSAKSRCGPPSC